MKKSISKIAFYCISAVLVLAMNSCSDDEGVVPDPTPDPMQTAYDMMCGQWQELYHYNYLTREYNVRKDSVLTINKDKTIWYSPNPDQTHSFEIKKIYKTEKDTLYCLVSHHCFDIHGSYKADGEFTYDFEGDILWVRENLPTGVASCPKSWYFKKIE